MAVKLSSSCNDVEDCLSAWNNSLKPDTHYPFERVVCIGLKSRVVDCMHGAIASFVFQEDSSAFEELNEIL